LPGPSQYPFRLILLALISLIGFTTRGQNQQIPLNYSYRLSLEKAMLNSEQNYHSSFLPLSQNQLGDLENDLDSLVPIFDLSKQKDKRGWKRKFFHEHLFILDSANYQLTLDPLFHFEYTSDEKSDETIYKNVRGFMLRLQLGDKIAVGSDFRENQARLPDYIAARTEASDVAYGQGRVKRLGPANYDFAMSSAYLSYQVIDRLNLTVGHGKHFIGQGYRSHLLSDLAFNYPYLRMNSSWWKGKINYQNLYALYQDLERVESETLAEELFERKFSAAHYLSFAIGEDLTVGLFENNIYPLIDSTGNRDIGVQPYLPLIFLNYFSDNKQEALASRLGLDLKYSPGKRTLLYAQLSSHDLSDGLLSYQIGAKYHALEDFRFGFEINETKDVKAEPTFIPGPMQSTTSVYRYLHYNESLSLPYSALDYNELIVSAEYQKNRQIYEARAHFSGGDLIQNFYMAQASYVVNPKMNSAVYLNLTYRQLQGQDDRLWISFGWRTHLQNLYFNY
jgi:hypothetical protein